MSNVARLPAGQGGFTLLEVVIALTLLGLMMTVLFSGLRFGARSWDAAGARVEAAQDRFLVERFLRRELSQARPLFWEPEGQEPSLAFQGDGDGVRFVAPLPAHRGGGGLHLFTVLFEEDGTFVVRHRLFEAALPRDELDDDLEAQVLAAGIERVTFAYFGIPEGGDEPAWQDSWRGQPHLPMLVRLRIEPGDEDALWPELMVPLHLRGSEGEQGVGGRGGVDFGPRPN